ncbi:MAG: ATP-binding protein [Candidatus Gastranaerophilales bacterium]|nr:ATP-binding protein [Candidatus Gastranaerophilales bacterium]
MDIYFNGTIKSDFLAKANNNSFRGISIVDVNKNEHKEQDILTTIDDFIKELGLLRKSTSKEVFDSFESQKDLALDGVNKEYQEILDKRTVWQKFIDKQFPVAKELIIYRIKHRCVNQKAKKNEEVEEGINLATKKMECLLADILKKEKSMEIERLKKASFNQNNLSAANSSFGFERIAGYDNIKKIFSKYFVEKIRLEQEGEPQDIYGSVLFFGPTGNGKSTFAKAFADETGCTLLTVRCSLDSEVNKLKEKFIERLMQKAEGSEKNFQATGKRSILLIEEIDRIINDNYDKDSNFIRFFTDFLKTCSVKYHCTVFATSNFPRNINLDMKDKEIFPVRIAVDPPDDNIMKLVLHHYLQRYSAQPIDYDAIIKELNDQNNGYYSNSQIRNICEAAYRSKQTLLTTGDVIEFIKNNSNKIKPAIDAGIIKDFKEDTATLMINELSGEVF